MFMFIFFIMFMLISLRSGSTTIDKIMMKTETEGFFILNLLILVCSLKSLVIFISRYFEPLKSSLFKIQKMHHWSCVELLEFYPLHGVFRLLMHIDEYKQHILSSADTFMLNVIKAFHICLFYPKRSLEIKHGQNNDPPLVLTKAEPWQKSTKVLNHHIPSWLWHLWKHVA